MPTFVKKELLMIKYFTLSLLFISLQSIAQDTTKVLFIGNSITYFNDMPQTFEAIANSKHDTTQVTVHAPGGTGFIHHADNPAVYDLFRQGKWDFVVLQPGSNESPGYSEPIASTLQRARKMKDSILFYNPCAKIVYYEISYGVWGSSASQLIQYNETMDLIRSNLTQLADSTEQFFAPAGEAIRASWNDDQTNMLWGATGDIHPNNKGSYIIACSFYASIFQKPSFGTNILNNLSMSEAERYQTLADTTVLNHKADWRINTFDVVPSFNYTTYNNIISFYNTSLNADSVSWDFGDGASSNLLNPIHTYQVVGDYIVALTAYKNGCAITLTEALFVSALDVDNQVNDLFDVFPNPSKGVITLFVPNNTDSYDYQIYSTVGQIMLFGNSVNDETFIDLSHLPNGLYFLTIQLNNRIISRRLVKN